MSDPPRRKVTDVELRRLFNDGGFAERVRTGALREVVFRSQSCALATEPPGTLSQMIAYYDGPAKVAIVHQYTRPDGTVGASGLPDPKALLIDGTLLFC